MSEPNNPSDEPKIVVDDDWKSQVEKKKEDLQQQTENKTEEHPDFPPASFSLLVTTLSTQVLAALGFIPDPMTGKPNQNRPMAKHFIDTLAVMEEKTKGNLTDDETALMTETLHQLRMAFVNAPTLEGEENEPKSSTIELP